MRNILTKAIAFDELKQRLKKSENPYLILVDIFLDDALKKAEERTQDLTLDRLTTEQLIQLAGPKISNVSS